MIWRAPLQHRLSAQRWADVINMWPNAVGTSKCPVAGKKCVWVSVGFIKMWIKNSFKNVKTLKKIKS